MTTRSREFADGVLVDARYRILSLLGSGGMGSVYEVEHVQLGKRFVLKSLHREYNDRKDLVARLRTEWLSLAKLHHPHIVNVTDAGTSEDGVAYFVMERLEGETLSERLRRGEPLPRVEALRIAREILEGLAAAHHIDVVHRDVKPANVYLVAGRVVKLLDFGIAKVTTKKTAITAHGVAIGTPRYMSPEQARGEKVDSRADVYAAALVLYEMLAGKGPFHAIRDSAKLILAQMVEPPPLLSSLIPSVDRELDELCASMLAKLPSDRPPSAAAVVVRLKEIERRARAAPLAAPLAGSTHTTLPGALVRTSEAPARGSSGRPSGRSSGRSARKSGAAQGRGAAASAGTAAAPGRPARPEAPERTEPLSVRAPATRTSLRASESDRVHDTGATAAPTSSRVPGQGTAARGRGLAWGGAAVIALAAAGAVAWTLSSSEEDPLPPAAPELAHSPAEASGVAGRSSSPALAPASAAPVEAAPPMGFSSGAGTPPSEQPVVAGAKDPTPRSVARRPSSPPAARPQPRRAGTPPGVEAARNAMLTPRGVGADADEVHDADADETPAAEGAQPEPAAPPQGTPATANGPPFPTGVKVLPPSGL